MTRVKEAIYDMGGGFYWAIGIWAALILLTLLTFLVLSLRERRRSGT